MALGSEKAAILPTRKHPPGSSMPMAAMVTRTWPAFMECLLGTSPRRLRRRALAEGDPAEEGGEGQDEEADDQQRRSHVVSRGIAQETDSEHRETAAGDQQNDAEDQRRDLTAAHARLPVRAGRPGR